MAGHVRRLQYRESSLFDMAAVQVIDVVQFAQDLLGEP